MKETFTVNNSNKINFTLGFFFFECLQNAWLRNNFSIVLLSPCIQISSLWCRFSCFDQKFNHFYFRRKTRCHRSKFNSNSTRLDLRKFHENIFLLYRQSFSERDIRWSRSGDLLLWFWIQKGDFFSFVFYIKLHPLSSSGPRGMGGQEILTANTKKISSYKNSDKRGQKSRKRPDVINGCSLNVSFA